MFKLNDAPPSSEVRPSPTSSTANPSPTHIAGWRSKIRVRLATGSSGRPYTLATIWTTLRAENVFGPGFASYSPLKRMTHCEWRRAATSFVSIFPSRNSHAFICAMAPTAKIVFSSTRAAGRRDTTRR